MRVWTDSEVRDLFMGVNVARLNDRFDAEMKEFDRWLAAHDERVVRKTKQRIIKLLEEEFNDTWPIGIAFVETSLPNLIELIKGETK